MVSKFLLVGWKRPTEHILSPWSFPSPSHTTPSSFPSLLKKRKKKPIKNKTNEKQNKTTQTVKYQNKKHRVRCVLASYSWLRPALGGWHTNLHLVIENWFSPFLSRYRLRIDIWSGVGLCVQIPAQCWVFGKRSLFNVWPSSLGPSVFTLLWRSCAQWVHTSHRQLCLCKTQSPAVVIFSF